MAAPAMRFLACIVCLTVASVISAAELQRCGDRPTQLEMNQCAAQDYAQADQELNRVYHAYRSRLSEEQKAQLRDAQRAWIPFRDLSCTFESSGVKGGSIYPFILQSCLAAMTRARTRQLQELARCKEGDLSCPVAK